MKNIIENMLMELGIVSVVLGWYFFTGDKGVNEMLRDGLGSIMMAFGIIWFIGAFLRLSVSWTYKIASLSTAAGLWLFGYVLQTFGFFHATSVIGGYLLFIAYIIGGVVESQTPLHIFKIGICMLLISLPLRWLTAIPEKPQPKIELFPDEPISKYDTRGYDYVNSTNKTYANFLADPNNNKRK